MEKHSVLLKEKKKKISLTERHMFSFPQCKFHMYIMLKREEKRERVCAFASLERQRKSFGGLPWFSDEDSELLLQGSQFWALVTEKIPCANHCGLKKLIKWVKTLLMKSIGNSEKLVTMPLPFLIKVLLTEQGRWQNSEGTSKPPRHLVYFSIWFLYSIHLIVSCLLN